MLQMHFFFIDVISCGFSAISWSWLAYYFQPLHICLLNPTQTRAEITLLDSPSVRCSLNVT